MQKFEVYHSSETVFYSHCQCGSAILTSKKSRLAANWLQLMPSSRSSVYAGQWACRLCSEHFRQVWASL